MGIVFLIVFLILVYCELWMWRYMNKILLYYNNTYNFLQIVMMITINYYYIIYK